MAEEMALEMTWREGLGREGLEGGSGNTLRNALRNTLRNTKTQ